MKLKKKHQTISVVYVLFQYNLYVGFIIIYPNCANGTVSQNLSLALSFPIFENPYPMDIHESPVTCVEYFADCPPDLIPVLYSVGTKHKKQGYSNKVKEKRHL